MKNSANIGRIRRADLRTIWQSEASDFTPWLLENADVLCELLGLDISIKRAEHPVGSFSLDLIGQVSDSDDVIIIENQLEESDHRHLGQILTYAGGTDAKHIVWIARSFREEHRQALEWLNERTDEQTRFFAVRLEAVTIGDSLPAPLLSLVVKPNDWGKAVRRTSPSSRSSIWLKKVIFEVAGRLYGNSVANTIESFLDYHQQLGADVELTCGSGAVPSVTLNLVNRDVAIQPWTLTVDSSLRLSINFDWIHKSGNGLPDLYMERFAERMSVLPGMAGPVSIARENQWHRRPGISGLPIFTDAAHFNELLKIMEEMYEELHKLN